jgi:hypothetical protein
MGFSALFFIKIINKLGAVKLTQWLALLTFLSFETIINYRGNIFRDQGYWAFYLISFFYLLEFVETPKIIVGLLWFFSTIIAILFRVEGISLLMFAPFAVLVLKNFTIKEKIIAFIKLYLPLFIVIPCMGLIFLFYGNETKQIFITLWHQIFMLFYLHGSPALLTKFQHVSQQFNDLVLPKAAKHGSAQIILLIGLTGYFIYKLIWNVGVLNVILILASYVKKLIPFKHNQKIIFYWLLIITILIPYNFLLENQFISTRYMVSGCITLLFFVPFALQYCIEHSSEAITTLFSRRVDTNKGKVFSILNLKALFILYLLISAADLIYLGITVYYKNTSSHIVKANMWLYTNRAHLSNVCSTDSWPIFAVDGPKISYSKVDSSLVSIMDKSSNCEYIVYVGSPAHYKSLPLLMTSPTWKPYKTFDAHNMIRSVYIYKRHS